ncbi:MAG: hypothetical protein AB1631_20685 [Acidobacteriota bacterium]
MKIKTFSATFLAAALVVATMPVPVFPQGKLSNAVGDVVFELVGQAGNPSPPPTLAQSQYGYLSYVNGISGIESIFSPGPQNETTALLTFFNDTVAERVINNGPIRIINRVGTTTIYLDTTPDGDFNNPDSFRDGLPVQTSVLRLQFVLDTITGAFTATFVNTITSSGFFQLGGHNFLLGKFGQKFRTTNLGHVNMSGSPAAHFAGFAVGDLKR